MAATMFGRPENFENRERLRAFFRARSRTAMRNTLKKRNFARKLKKIRAS